MTLPNWAIAAIAAAGLSYLGWLGVGTASNTARLSATEADHITFTNWLGRIEDKLDRVIEQRSEAPRQVPSPPHSRQNP